MRIGGRNKYRVNEVIDTRIEGYSEERTVVFLKEFQRYHQVNKASDGSDLKHDRFHSHQEKLRHHVQTHEDHLIPSSGKRPRTKMLMFFFFLSSF